ncbi:TPA: GPW/gp25 family protein [Klebsiella pneumoniae]|uniref:GPW/gp25 family protein n=1 Tax=Klebsiella pneumoniae TaxID=573 RepID=UPI000E2EF5F2|nr:GPW/gp25 family protein [Klebsiella pneumoniae]HBR1366661.1 GPW/gp25 family protein [Klebsiella pneumoniae]HBR2015012.1 GPW/gp25 family protein [Klebsiella pneumoniae]
MTATYTGLSPDTAGAVSDHDQLWGSVRKILTTPIGSRVMRRDFGSYVPELIDGPENAVTRLQLMSVAAMALARWEPRINLTTVNVVYTREGAVTAELSGTIIETMTETSSAITLRG